MLNDLLMRDAHLMAYYSAFQPVQWYALVQMRKPCGADEHGQTWCG